ncbi:MAG: hypothetical protein J6X02_01685, partial [Bacilli bacterium]|nr:hypothetical protein [Bacilli bacterium]
MNRRIKRFGKMSKDEINGFIDHLKYIWQVIVLFFKEKGKWNKIKKLFRNFHKFLKRKNIYPIFLFVIIFIIMDFATRLLALDISFYKLWRLIPRLFSLGYIILFIGIIFSLKRKHGLIAYFTIFFVFFTLFLVNNVYYDATK